MLLRTRKHCEYDWRQPERSGLDNQHILCYFSHILIHIPWPDAIEGGCMIQLFASVCIEAPAEAVWIQLAKLEDIQLWSEAVLHARSTGAVSQGVGAERVCELVGKRTITEHWIAWEEGRSFSYEG